MRSLLGLAVLLASASGATAQSVSTRSTPHAASPRAEASSSAHPRLDWTATGGYPYLGYLIRFGRWADILKEQAPPADLRFSTGMWHYGRGLAFAGKEQRLLASVGLRFFAPQVMAGLQPIDDRHRRRAVHAQSLAVASAI